MYIQNFNWFSRWIEKYALTKVTDQLGILVSVFFIAFLLFKNFKFKSKISIIDIKILLFYSIILVIFFIWFTKHPQLRYGGYSIVFLTLSIPIALIYQKMKDKNFFNKKLKYLLILIVLIFTLSSSI